MPLTHGGKHGRVVEVAGEGGQHLRVVRVLLFVLHHHLEGQFWVVGADDGGRRAATARTRGKKRYACLTQSSDEL